MSGQLFVISGASGAGKSTIVKALIDRIKGIGYSISHTSRKPRDSEKDGVDYHFLDRGRFKTMIKSGEFLEWAQVYQAFYGTSYSTLDEQRKKGLDVILDVDSQGAGNIREQLENTVLIYVLPPSLEALEKRLRHRGMDDENVIKTRMETAVDEIEMCVKYDYIIINDDLEEAIEKTQAIIISERCRLSRQSAKLKELFNISLGTRTK